MAYSQSDIDALTAAIATAARKVRYADGREVEYRSLTEMRAILAEMQAALAPASARTLADDRVVTGVASGLSRAAPFGLDYWRC